MIYNHISDNVELLDEWISNAELIDIIYLSRYSYTYLEQSLLPDKVYDELIEKVRDKIPETQLYEDDVYPESVLDIIAKLGLPNPNEVKHENSSELQYKIDNYVKKFNTNQSMGYFSNIPTLLRVFEGSEDSFIVSYKHDGWNISSYYIPGNPKPVFAHTRGRDGADIRDCTGITQTILPEMNVTSLTKVVSELVIRRPYMDYLRKKYTDREWVNIRSSVSTFIAGNVLKEDYKCLDMITFNIIPSDNPNISKVNQFALLQKNGFTLPFAYLAKNLNEVHYLLDEAFPNYYKEYSLEYECDGVTVATAGLVPGNQGIVAYKGGVWDSEIMESYIEDIYLSYNRKRFTPIAKIEPVISRIGNRITNVPLINLRLIQNNWLQKGDKIRFQYQSQQNVYFLEKIVEKDDNVENKEDVKEENNEINNEVSLDWR